MGKNSTPNAMKVLNGEKNKERFNPEGVAVEKLSSAPECPDWMDVRAVKLFERKSGLLLGLQILTKMDLDYLYQLCALESKMIKLWSAGETPNMSMFTQYDKFCSKFGFNIVDREKLHAPVQGKTSRWDKRKK